MKRYIVDKRALNVLNIRTLNACNELRKEQIVDTQPLEFSHLPFISVILSNEDINRLVKAGYNPTEEVTSQSAALGRNYEKIRSSYHKAHKKTLTGLWTRVGIIDSGCNTDVVPCDVTENFANPNPFNDVFGHGTMVTSIIKHPTMGIAPYCEMHHLKAIDDNGSITESSVLAALDYALQNELDIINLSFQYDSINFRAAIEQCVNTNMVVCAGAGNSSVESPIVVPAALPGVVAVACISENGSPLNYNIIPNPTVPQPHGVSIACSGVSCEVYDKNGNYISAWGSSFASPFFAGVFALYKQELAITDNKEVLEFVYTNALKTWQPRHFGVGTPSF